MQHSPIIQEELVILGHSAIRCLIAKGVLSKDDLMADLARMGIDAEVAFRLKAVLNDIPQQ
jgi:hypothetical protein